ncbi:MAG: DUF1232 domain-containing protein [Acidaminococcales bacterium]|jgi:uncharacterized membrane protein YkvA (DUF1232 family)|nr:DUF1232 domain-containing protein [Acidaminococcales bacterium]
MKVRKVLAVLCGAAYVVSPIDIIPDLLPLLGQADDLGAIVLVIKYVMSGTKAKNNEEV